jgi:predicted helicase
MSKDKGPIGDLFGGISEENVARIKRQNARKISVIIWNPPYNANQLNENENNKNRQYPAIDQRIKATYIKASTAQKTKLYDMYARFFRWATDRVAENGIVAFVSNRSFIESRTFDGFRKTVAEDFNDIHVIDLGGDVRTDPRLSGTKHNVFGIQTGVAISFMIKRGGAKGCRIRYCRRPQLETAEEKLAFLGGAWFQELGFEELQLDGKKNWISPSADDFGALLPVVDKATLSTRIRGQERAIFKRFYSGISTNRDEWLYDSDKQNLKSKILYMIRQYDRLALPVSQFGLAIKWSETLKRRKSAARSEEFREQSIVRIAYRPFVNMWLHRSPLFIDRPGIANALETEASGSRGANGSLRPSCIVFTDPAAMKPWLISVVSLLPDLHYVGAAAGAVCVPRITPGSHGDVGNVTDWALEQFARHYRANPQRRKEPITKDAIVWYVYGVLHDPIYREKYALNLKREFPRIPFYADFWRWADWGEALANLHIGYETVEPWPFRRLDTLDERSRKAGLPPTAMLKANKDIGAIQLDSETQLSGIPREAWDYRLGNRSALEWILDQHKEKTPKDPTIREKFNTYRFADHKEKVIDLLMRVTRVSVETVAIVEAMRRLPRAGAEEERRPAERAPLRSRSLAAPSSSTIKTTRGRPPS